MKMIYACQRPMLFSLMFVLALNLKAISGGDNSTRIVPSMGLLGKTLETCQLISLN